MSDLFTRSRTVILRNWRELSPKLAVGLLTGSTSGALLEFAASNGIQLNTTGQYAVVIIGFFIGGYIKSETFPTIQDIERDLPKAEAVAEHVIHPPRASDASPATSPVKIVPSAPLVMTPSAPVSEDDKETQVLPSTPGAAFLNNLNNRGLSS